MESIIKEAFLIDHSPPFWKKMRDGRVAIKVGGPWITPADRLPG